MAALSASRSSLQFRTMFALHRKAGIRQVLIRKVITMTKRWRFISTIFESDSGVAFASLGVSRLRCEDEALLEEVVGEILAEVEAAG